MEDIWFFILIYFLKNIFIDIDGPFYVCKLVESHHQKQIRLHH
jgi:hypothetical protein